MKNIVEVTLTREEQLRAKHDFFRRIKDPELSAHEFKGFSAACASLFKEYFPDIS